MLKAKLLKVADNRTSSFDIRHEQLAFFDNPWHYHPEFELTLVVKSTGIRFVGDCVEPFEEGDLVLLGSNLPHYWRNNAAYYDEGSTVSAEAYILRFRHDHILKMIHEAPETTGISELLKKASRGIWFSKSMAQEIQPLVTVMLQSQGVEKIIGFLELMHRLAGTDQYKILSTTSFIGSNPDDNTDRMNKVLNFIHKNLHTDISLKDVALCVSMNATAFCRYIKSQTNKTFVELLNDIRISNACRLLSGSSRNIAEIAYDCGFRNVTHFNYTFKKITGETPSAYRKKLGT